MTALTISGSLANYIPHWGEEASVQQREPYGTEDKEVSLCGEDVSFQYLEHWRTDDKEVVLLRKGTELIYKVVNTLTGKSTHGPIDLAGYNIEDVISYLLKCQRVVDDKAVKFSPRLPLPYIQRWIIGDREISLHKEGEQLSYEVLNTSTGKSLQGPIDLAGNNVEDAIPFLLKCQPELSETQEVIFVPNPNSHYSWKFGNKKIVLLQKDQDLIWQFIDKSTKTISQAPFQVGSLCWDIGRHCFSPKTPNLLSGEEICKSPQQPLKFRQKMFKDSEIEKIDITPVHHSSAYRLNSIRAKKIVGKSLLDSSLTIDRDRWAVTLINSGRSGVSDPLTWGGHAAIIIEGRKKGAFFIYKAHLRNIKGKAVVLLQPIEDKKILYSQKGKTWKVNRAEAKRMIEIIKWEIERQNQNTSQEEDSQKENSPVFFDIRGRDSMLVKPRVIKEYDSYQDLVKDALGPECLDSSSSSHTVPYKSITLIDKNGKKKVIDNRQFEIQSVQFSSPRRLFIQNSVDEKWREVNLPDNCLTWAIKKLEYCGIYQDGGSLKSIIALPRTVVTQGRALKDYAVSRLFSRKLNTSGESEGFTPLMRAINEGDIEKVQTLLSGDIDLYEKNNHGFTALHLACEIGDSRIVDLLHKKGMNINEPADDPFRSTPLFLAIKNNHEDLIWFLLELGVKVNQKDVKTGNTILHLISDFYPSDLVIPEIFIKENVNEQNNNGMTPLMLSVVHKKKGMVEQLLKSGALVDQGDHRGHTALWHAYFATSAASHIEDEKLMRLLVKYGVNLNTFHAMGYTLLHVAAFHKEFEIAKMFLQSKASVDPKDKRGRTPFWYAYHNEDAKMMRLLIEYGTNLNDIFGEGTTPLIQAVKDKKFNVAQWFLQEKASVGQKDKKGRTPFWYAYHNEDAKMMRLLIEYGTNLNDIFGEGTTPLIQAVKDKKFNVARWFLQEKASVGQKDKKGHTPLEYAYENRDAKMMQLLIEYGADLITIFDSNSTPLIQAVKEKDLEIAFLFLRNKLPVYQKDRLYPTLLKYAYENGDARMVQLLIEYGANLNKLGPTPLIRAVKEKKFEVARVFLQKKVPADQKDKWGHTALWHAYKNEDEEMIELLIEYGADLKAAFDGSSPLIEAAKEKKIEMARLFLQKKVPVDQKNEWGHTALWHAYNNEDEEMIELLIEYGVNLNVAFSRWDESLPLIKAVEDKKLEMARLLLQNKASVDQKDKYVNTALWYAYRNGDEEMIKLLIEYGVNLNEAFDSRIIPLIKAVKDKKLEMARLFLQNKACVDQKDELGHTALWHAYQNGDEKMIELFIEFGARLNETFSSKVMLFIEAVKDKKLEMARLFLENEVSVYQKDAYGNMALGHALNNGDEEMVKMLIEYGVNLNVAFGRLDALPLIKAVKDKKLEMARLFLQNKACVDQKDELGHTALWHAYQNGDEGMMELLIEFGANFEEYSIFNKTDDNFRRQVSAALNRVIEEQIAKNYSSSQEPKNSSCLVS